MMLTSMATLACMAALALAAGCADDGNESNGSGAGSGSTHDVPADRCPTSCETYARCEGFPLSGCEGDIDCSGWPSALWRTEVATAYAECQASCPPADSDTCVMAAFAAAGAARTVDDEYTTACDAVEERCASLPNDVCGEQSLYPETVVRDALPCLQAQCASVGACLDDVLQR